MRYWCFDWGRSFVCLCMHNGDIQRQCPGPHSRPLLQCFHWIKFHCEEKRAQESWHLRDQGRCSIGIIYVNMFFSLFFILFILLLICLRIKNQVVLMALIVVYCLYKVGSGGFSYLYEPLWWLGMIASKNYDL